MKYIILRKRLIDSLVLQVNSYGNSGYGFVGGVIWDGEYYCQAMVKYD